MLLVTGELTIKLQMESILWSSFTVVSGKWELCFHGHELSNGFTVGGKFPSSPVLLEMFVVFSSLDICYLLCYNNRELKGAAFQLYGLWERRESTFWTSFLTVMSFLLPLAFPDTRNAIAKLWWKWVFIYRVYILYECKLRYIGFAKKKKKKKKPLWILREQL